MKDIWAFTTKEYVLPFVKPAQVIVVGDATALLPVVLGVVMHIGDAPPFTNIP